MRRVVERSQLNVGGDDPSVYIMIPRHDKEGLRGRSQRFKKELDPARCVSVLVLTCAVRNIPGEENEVGRAELFNNLVDVSNDASTDG